MFAIRFIYDLAGVPKPKEEELDEEIDRLFYLKTAESPNYLVNPENCDALANLDSDILNLWLTKKFKTAFILMLIHHNDNKYISRQELAKMDRYQTLVDMFLRSLFLENHAMKRVRETYFANPDIPTMEHSIIDLKRTLTFISEHLENNSSEFNTLLGTDTYTTADVTFYCFLKRIFVGKYKNFGLQSHVKLCDPLIRFMRRYANKNIGVIDVSGGDPLANKDQESSLVADLMKPAIIGGGIILFYLWRRDHELSFGKLFG